MTNILREQAQQMSQEVAGGIAVAIGGAGTTYQLVTQVLSMTALVVNVILGLCGLYLMRHKLFDQRRDRRKDDNEIS